MKSDKISSNRYGIMMDEWKEKKLELEGTKHQGETNAPSQVSREKKGPPKRKSTIQVPELENENTGQINPPIEEISTGEDGYSYWEDENGQWWVQMPDGEWTEWND
jgi:hypothetical protein